ncbi:MAG TPA: exodeoxyribonuclease VII large subunit [Solimonas sp.]
MPPAPASPRTVHSVTELAETLRDLVEGSLPRTWVQGEISNLARPASGHWYFTLKDAGAQLRAVMFRNANLHVRPPPRDGDAVLVRAQVSVYTARGDLQLICEHLEPAGQGALLRAFEELKRKLAGEGLFDEHLKRELPALPRAIGLVTSGSGAAIQDVLTTLSRRYPLAPVYLYPVPVQGAEAPPAIVRALHRLPLEAPQVDVLLLVRGGGSLEDLWAFNDERVARAIRACAVPVISGVGHETDTTIADFAADLRAPTPTAAAERVAPDLGDWRERLDAQHARTAQTVLRALREAGLQQQRLTARLQAQHPGRRLLDRAQRLDDLGLRAARAQQVILRRQRERLLHLQLRLSRAAPDGTLARGRARLAAAALQLHAAWSRQTAPRDMRLQRAQARLVALNPRAVLERGYAIALSADGRALTDATALQRGDALRVLLAHGGVDVTVERTHPDAPPSG